MRVISWNVNGLRACARKGFLEWLATCGADFVGVQEVRSPTSKLPPEVAAPEGWHAAFFESERAGYSGVGSYSRRPPDAIETHLGVRRYDTEGRLQIVRLGALSIANVYFPNGSGKDRDNSRVPFKLAFYRRLYKRLNRAKLDGAPILVMGDFNTAHQAIDLARPKPNRKTSGFLLEECEELSRWFRGGWTDTFRQLHPGEAGHYTWWSQRFGVRAKNIGWRIDYVLASPGAMPFVKAASIHPDVMGSDHCPISVELDPAVVA